MTDKLPQFQERMSTALNEYQTLCFMTRAIELQTQAADDLEALKQDGVELKKEVVTAGDENEANTLLAFENVIDTLISELRMWVALKNDDPFAAWNFLIDAQMAAIDSVRAHPVAEHMAKYAKRLDLLEKLLFPPQVFSSPGMVIKSAECSICRKEYGTCEHVRGRPYMGEFCARIIKDWTLTEVSIVGDPANKQCIVTSFSRDGVHCVDRMTLRRVEPSESNSSSEQVESPER